LTVWCVKNGDKYTDRDVQILASMAKKHIKTPYQFKCLADKPVEGIETVISKHNWPGWWMKLELFEHATEGQHLYLDLDVVIVGSLDSLLSSQLSMPKNWAQSGHGGCQSSVMAWGRSYSFIPGNFHPEEIGPPQNGNCGYYKGLWGDQEFITELCGNPGEHVIAPMDGIYSYKYHCKATPPNDAKVICFHGNPKPDNVNKTWVKNARTNTCKPSHKLAS